MIRSTRLVAVPVSVGKEGESEPDEKSGLRVATIMRSHEQAQTARAARTFWSSTLPVGSASPMPRVVSGGESV